MNQSLSSQVIAWQRIAGRHSLPWQNTRDPYKIWLSEVMLQQTQVATVIGYYKKFLEQFPTVTALANAPIDSVLALWAGLGYYSRARNLHRCAQIICSEHGAGFPNDQNALVALPGIGRSTAAAILAFSYGASTPILDANVKRVFCRYFGVTGFPGEPKVHNHLWTIAEQQMPQNDVEAYTQGLMDLGATLCKGRSPSCAICPLSATCIANLRGLQTELPERKPKKLVPVKEHWFLYIHQSDNVILQRQPEVGIWGGLYSLPRIEAPETTSLLESMVPKLEQHWHLKVLAISEGPAFAHAFTHYKLNARVIHVQATKSTQRVTDASLGGFYSPAEIASLGLPSPIQKYLAKNLLLF